MTPNWTPEEYEQHQARRSGNKPSRSKPEPVIQNEPVAAPQGEAGHPGRVHVHVVSFRRRLLDPDNLCPKYFVDCLRYAGYIQNDRPQDIALEVRQERVTNRADERTEITIEPISETGD